MSYEDHDFRARSIGRGRFLAFFASTPVNGAGDALPRRRWVMVGPWCMTFERKRPDSLPKRARS